MLQGWWCVFLGALEELVKGVWVLQALLACWGLCPVRWALEGGARSLARGCGCCALRKVLLPRYWRWGRCGLLEESWHSVCFVRGVPHWLDAEHVAARVDVRAGGYVDWALTQHSRRLHKATRLLMGRWLVEVPCAAATVCAVACLKLKGGQAPASACVHVLVGSQCDVCCTLIRKFVITLRIASLPHLRLSSCSSYCAIRSCRLCPRALGGTRAAISGRPCYVCDVTLVRKALKWLPLRWLGHKQLLGTEVEGGVQAHGHARHRG